MDVDLPYELQLVTDLRGHEERAWQIAWNPVEPLLASCSADKSVRLYNYQPSNESLKFSHIHSIPTGHTKTVRSLAWSPSGKTLATGSFDSNVGIWEREGGHDGDEEAADWECMTLLEGHETECKSVAYSSSGTLLASCSRDKTVWVWEVHPDSDFECMGVLMEHTQDVKCVAWHPSEEILASASYDDTIKLYIDDPSEDWFCFSTLTGHKSTVWALAWSPKGSYLASSSDDLTIKIWKRVAEHKWECALELKGHERSIYSISWGKGKTGEESLGWLASTGGDGKINVWDIREPPESSTGRVLSHKLIATLSSAHDVSDVNSISWCPREGFEDLLATAGDDGSVRVWKVVPSH
ncbi:WD40 repeat-like protein [Leucogyrophana mollusca]|uniref:WD40 repeat-like protein n=1 Tax=Leucogyrophana mollusca TaxID=85980 RepID=A0ACB8BB26_9AGAM|nr:WD40 repeat-like protein [Leucogyrophana mollusca]